MPQKISTGFRALIEDAEREIETLSVADALSLHGRDDVVFVDLRDPRELEREGACPAPSTARAACSILDRSRQPLLQAGVRRGQALPVLLRRRLAFGAGRADRAPHGTKACRSHQGRVRRMEEGQRSGRAARGEAETGLARLRGFLARSKPATICCTSGAHVRGAVEGVESAMRFRHFSALSMLVSGVFVTIALHGAAAQAPPPPASGQPAPAASPANPPPPSQAAPPPPPTATAPPPPTAAAPPPPPPQAAAPPDGPPPPQSGPAGHAAAHAVTHANVNLRNGPGTTFTVVTLIPAGSSVAVNGCRSGWCQVAFQDQNGYIIETSIAPGGPGPDAPDPRLATAGRPVRLPDMLDRRPATIRLHPATTRRLITTVAIMDLDRMGVGGAAVTGGAGNSRDLQANSNKAGTSATLRKMNTSGGSRLTAAYCGASFGSICSDSSA